MAVIGDVGRFPRPNQLVEYLRLDPRVRQSGDRPAYTGHISRQGQAHARGLLVEAAHSAIRTPGPLRAFHERTRARGGPQIAAVAVARKLAILAWHLLHSGTLWRSPPYNSGQVSLDCIERICDTLGMANSNELVDPERNEGDQRPDPEVVATVAALDRILGPAPRCPMCAGTEWAPFPHDLGLAFTNPDTQDEIATSAHSVLFTCVKCGFIRLHGIPSNV